MKRIKQIISIVLVVAMLISMIPAVGATASAFELGNFVKRNTYTAKTYADVNSSDWYYENVRSAYEYGLMVGDTNGKFNPNSNITIAELITIAARIHSIYYTGNDDFANSTPWYKAYTDYAKTTGIAGEYADYNAYATREQFASIIVNALPNKALEEINAVADDSIPDVSVNDPYGRAVYKLYRAGIAIGNDNAEYKPGTTIKRSEVAAIATRMVDKSLRKTIQLGETYTVYFNIMRPGKTSEKVTVGAGQTVKEIAAPNVPGVPFEGWYTERTGGEKYNFSTPVYSDITLYAHWNYEASGIAGIISSLKNDSKIYTVTFDSNGGSYVEIQEVVKGGYAFEPKAPTREGYTFEGWYTQKNGGVEFDFDMPINGDVTVYAKWSEVVVDDGDSDDNGTDNDYIITPDLNTKRNNELKNIAEINNGVLPEIYLEEDDGTPQFIMGKYSDEKVTDYESAINSLNDVKNLMLMESAEDSFAGSSIEERNGKIFYKLQQTYKGLRVYGKQVIVATDKNGEITALSADFDPLFDADITPTVSEADARKVASDACGYENTAEAELVIYSIDDADVLAWFYSDTICDIFVDANACNLIALYDNVYTAQLYGQVVGRYGTITVPVVFENNKYFMQDTLRDIYIFDINGKKYYESDSAVEITSPDNNWNGENDVAAAQCYNNLKRTYNYYQSILGLNSFDGEGTSIVLGVNGKDEGVKAYTYLGISTIGERFGFILVEKNHQEDIALDIMAHEFTHRVETAVSEMSGYRETGAIREAYSDIMGELVEETVLGKDVVNWINSTGRNMIAPKSANDLAFGFSGIQYVYPAQYQGEGYLIDGDNDTFIHHNSTVISHALYKLYTETNLTNQQMAELLYHTLFYLPQNCTFSIYYEAIYQSAIDLGLSSDIKGKIIEVFRDEAAIPMGEGIKDADWFEMSRVGGTIYDSSTGNTVPNAIVIIREGNDNRTGLALNLENMATTDGFYRFDNLEPGYYTIEVSSEGYNTEYRTIVAGIAYEIEDLAFYISQDIYLTPVEEESPTSTVTGSITANPMPSVTVTLKDSTGSTVGTPVTTSGGSYTFANVAPGTYTLTFTAAGYKTETRTVNVGENGGTVTVDAVTMTKVPTYAITGSITCDTDMPSVTVTLNDANRTSVKTSTGSYTFSNIADGTYTLTFSAANHTANPTSVSVTVNGSNATAQEVKMIKNKVAFNVAHGSENLIGTTEQLCNNDGYATWTITTDSTTSWSISEDIDWLSFDKTSGTGSGTVKLTVSGYTLSTSGQSGTITFTADGKTYTVDVFRKAYCITGTVMADNYPLTGASVVVYNSDGFESSLVVTVEDGRFSIPVYDANYEIRVTAPSFSVKTKVVATPVNMENGNVDVGTIEMLDPISASGTVVDATVGGTNYGNTISGVTVTVTDSTGTTITTTTTDDNGSYTLGFPKAGTYDIMYVKDGYQTVTTNPNVYEGMETIGVVSMVESSSTTEIVANGICGENLTWTIKDSGELIISGVGEMKDYVDNEQAPWDEYASMIKIVTINKGVTNVGSYAFDDCFSEIIEINLSESVVKIGYGAFASCINLSNILLPKTLISIDDCAFSDCERLSNIKIPDMIAHIGHGAFYNTKDYNNNWETDVLYIDNWLIEAKKTISGEYSIKSGTLGIAENAFHSCEKIESIAIPDGLRVIDRNAFYYCSALMSINIPSSVIRIGSDILNCTAIYQDTDNWEDNGLYIDNWLICVHPRTESEYIIKLGTTALAELAFRDCDIKKVIIPEGITKISDGAFNQTKLEEIEFPTTLVDIGDYAFYGCDFIKSIDIPSSVTSIGAYAFAYCTNLQSITIPKEITRINDRTFIGCKNIETVNFSPKIVSIGDEAFFNCYKLRAVELPINIVSIGERAFSNCHDLSDINLPQGLQSIGEAAFANCSKISSIVIPESVILLGASVFFMADDIFSLEEVYFEGDIPMIWETRYDFFGNMFPDTVILYYVFGKSGWTSPTWTAPDGVVYNTKIFTP